jgi:hypothetical protein
MRKLYFLLLKNMSLLICTQSLLNVLTVGAAYTYFYENAGKL